MKFSVSLEGALNGPRVYELSKEINYPCDERAGGFKQNAYPYGEFWQENLWLRRKSWH